MSRQQKITKYQLNRFMLADELRRSGKTQREIAEYFGVSLASARRYLVVADKMRRGKRYKIVDFHDV
jgi:hypothetical protein